MAASAPFQFQTRMLLSVVALFAIGMALSVNATIGARMVFLISFGVFWIGIACVTYVVDTQTYNLATILTLLFGQTLVLSAMCVLVGATGVILRSLLTPYLLTS